MKKTLTHLMNQAPSPRPTLRNFDVFKVQNNSNYKDSNITLRVKMREKSKEKLPLKE